jgi:hypothetical protein
MNKKSFLLHAMMGMLSASNDMYYAGDGKIESKKTVKESKKCKSCKSCKKDSAGYYYCMKHIKGYRIDPMAVACCEYKKRK